MILEWKKLIDFILLFSKILFYLPIKSDLFGWNCSFVYISWPLELCLYFALNGASFNDFILFFAWWEHKRH